MKKVITMITVLCDGNYLFHKTFGIFSGFGSKSPGDILSSDTERNMFLRKVITDLCYSLNQIPDLHRVIFCKDSRSWRKDYKITRSVYKESRVKSEGVDWGSFFKLMDEFGEFLEENGYIYSRFGGAEGDDLIWAWCDYLRDKDDSVIVISGDKDMHQLVSSSNKNWIGIWNSNSKNKRCSGSHNWERKKDEDLSIFDVDPSSGANDCKIDKFLSSCVIEKVPTKEFVFKKILMGDKKDDVPGVFPHLTKSGKPSNIAEGCSRNSNTELIRFLEISLGSCFELETQIEISKNLKFIPEQDADQIIHQLHQLQSKISSYRTFLKKHPNTPQQPNSPTA